MSVYWHAVEVYGASMQILKCDTGSWHVWSVGGRGKVEGVGSTSCSHMLTISHIERDIPGALESIDDAALCCTSSSLS